MYSLALFAFVCYSLFVVRCVFFVAWSVVCVVVCCCAVLWFVVYGRCVSRVDCCCRCCGCFFG